MTPFTIDPRWYEECWYGDAPDESEADAPPKLRTRRFGRVAVCLALVVAVPALTYLGYEATSRNPVPDTAPAYQG